MIHSNSEFRAYALIRQIYCIEHSLAVFTTTSHDYYYYYYYYYYDNYHYNYYYDYYFFEFL